MLFGAFLTMAIPDPLPEIVLTPGLVIRESVRVKPGEYLIPNGSDSGRAGAIRIEGDGLTVDFQGAVLRGTPAAVEPDERAGTGVTVSGERITIRAANVHGYKVGLFAERAHGLAVLDSDLSFQWKQRLGSDREREDLRDWMSFHHNEKDEWLRYGAAIYLLQCDRAVVRRVRVWGGQCGLMMTECSDGLVAENDMSFLSAVGLGMYRSSRNRVMHNKFDWCVRGYSHGVYSRGQDSTAILVYEQSHDNVFAYNSATHGGDGFFLWAGQTTMDTGEGGCNDNLVFGNDFSHAPANGIEATFSRNVFANNLLVECGHGLWGGYSFDSLVVGNVFGLNGGGVAIEHGQHNFILQNVFDRDGVGVRLWANERQDPDWGYPKHRDTRNVGTVIGGNLFSSCATVAIDLGRGEGIEVDGNVLFGNRQAVLLRPELETARIVRNVLRGPAEDWARDGVATLGNVREEAESEPAPVAVRPSMVSDASTDGFVAGELARLLGLWNPWPDVGAPLAPRGLAEGDEREAEGELRRLAPEPLAGALRPFLPPGHPRGRRFIVVDEWGPYDFRRPILHEAARKTVDGREEVTLAIWGPAGEWTLTEALGLRVSSESGSVPGEVTVAFEEAEVQDVGLTLTYRGGDVVDHRGVTTRAGTPYRFAWSEWRFPIAWRVSWFAWDEATDPRTQPDAFARLLAGEPIRIAEVTDLDVVLPRQGVPDTRFATLAEGVFTAPAGEYVIEVTTDDGVRAWLDGRPLVEDAWRYQGPTTYSRPVRLDGAHRLRVEHFQIDGYATLRVKVRRAT